MRSDSLRPDRQVGRFRLLCPLGRGSFAEVWKAVHTSGTEVAIKVAHRAGDRTLHREAVRIAELDHPGIVQAYDSGSLEGRPWLAIELAEGTLAEHNSPLPVRDLAAHLLRALAYLHARDILHRDLKPTNILVGCRPRVGWDSADRSGVRLADFGIAWTGEGNENEVSGGSPGWASPEQARDQPGGREPSADLYSLAKIVEHLLEGSDEGPWGAWLARALHVDPAARFPTAAHALASLPERELTVLPGSPAPASDTATRPILDPMPTWTTRPRPEPVALAELEWPAQPPFSPLRLPKKALLDTGLALLAHRPTPLVGRLPQLFELWSEARETGAIAVTGASEDVDEVVGTLTRWAREVGRSLAVHEGATEVTALPLWVVRTRLGALGIEPVSALRLAGRCTGWGDAREQLGRLVDEGRVVATDDGLLVQELDPVTASNDVDVRFDEAWWTGDGRALTEAMSAIEQDGGDPRRKELLRLLGRLRLENPDDPELAHRALEASKAARAAGWTHLAEGLAVAGVSVLAKGHRTQEALEVLAELPELADERLASNLASTRGFLGFQSRHPDAEAWLEAAGERCEGRHRISSLALRTEIRMIQGDGQGALALAREAVRQVDVRLWTPDDAVAAYLAVVLALRHAGADPLPSEGSVALLFEQAAPYAQASTNPRVHWRFLLFRADLAMGEERWADAEQLLADAQAIASRRGRPDTFIVLNQGRLGLRRGDLSSIPAITPDDWLERTTSSSAQLRDAMRLHQLLVGLGSGDESTIEAALAFFEAREGPSVPAIVEELKRAATLAPPRHQARIAALASDEPPHARTDDAESDR